MKLNKKMGQGPTRTDIIEDEMGRQLPAMDVIALSIKYLVDDLHAVVDSRLAWTVNRSEIYWVITVPAIWTDAAKQFMREAAEKTNIPPHQLGIALEPEAASLLCRHLSVDTTVNKSNFAISKLPTGSKYMILDAGGGTVDITVHEIQNGDSLKEIIPASGGDWGGTMIDRAFEALVVDIVGKKTYDEFKRTETEDWLEMARGFEVKKREANTEDDTSIPMWFPVSLSEIYEEQNKQKPMDSIRLTKYADAIEIKKDRIEISKELFNSLFNESVHKITNHLKPLLQDRKLSGLKAILMVGGYSESPILQNAVRKVCQGCEVVIPLGASSAVLKGALVYGHSPMSMSQRTLKYTYGVVMNEPFVPGRHPESRRFKTDKGDHCSGIFSKFVEKGQSVKTSETQVTKVCETIHHNQNCICFIVYASNKTDPRFVDEDGCKSIGMVDVKLERPGADIGQKVSVSMTFSDTEIIVDAVDMKSGKKTKVDLNFLG